ncbi:hypothetical protein ACP4OV_005303 [Aristida adscensionis]
MADVQEITHCAHPAHRLRKTDFKAAAAKTTCNICGIPVAKSRGGGFTCVHSGCTFNLHKECSACFKEIAKRFYGGQDTLTLQSLPKEKQCAVCRKQCPKGSVAYRYDGSKNNSKDYTVHPVCTLFPEKISHPPCSEVLDLTMKRVTKVKKERKCGVCGGASYSPAPWLYVSQACKVHPMCLYRGCKDVRDDPAAVVFQLRGLIEKKATKEEKEVLRNVLATAAARR